MGEWQNIKTEIKDKVAVLTVDHPPVNSFNAQVVTELGQAMDELLADDKVKVIVITGAGSKAFIAGADIPEIQAALEKPDGLKKTAVRGQALFLKIEKATKPIIAAINGFCLGGGMERAMSCTSLGAMPNEGSSSSSSRGLAISALPITIICCSPPLNVPAACE